MFSAVFDIDLKVYVAGVLVRNASVMINHTFNSFPTASVSIPPITTLFGIGRNDRVPVLIFIKNVFCSPEDKELYGKYILLFEGTIHSYMYMNDPVNREITIECEHVLSYLKDINVITEGNIEGYASSYLPGMAYSGKINRVADFVYPYSLFIQGFSIYNSKDPKPIDYPYQYLENVNSFLTNIPDKETGIEESATDIYYREYTNMLNFASRIGKVYYFDVPGKSVTPEQRKEVAKNPSSLTDCTPLKASVDFKGGPGFPILKALQNSLMLQTVANVFNAVAEMSKYGSVYDTINYLVNTLEYDFYISVSPYYDKSKSNLRNMFLKPLFYEALPPRCNIVFPCQIVGGISFSEKVHGVTTRVISRDDSSPVGLIALPSSAILSKYVTLAVYNEELENDPKAEKTVVTKHLTKIEKFTGPFTFDIPVPPWLHYLNSNNEPDKTKADALYQDLTNKFLKHMYTLKRYENRNMTVVTTFNPYIAVGFPIVVYDNVDTDLVFVGHVLSVSHNINKGGATTTISISFARTLQEAVMNPIKSTVPEVDEVAKDPDNMAFVYSSIFGYPVDSPTNTFLPSAVCLARLYYPYATQEEQDFLRKNKGISSPFIFGDEFVDPRQAYDFNKRNIVTLEDYLQFMHLTPAQPDDPEIAVLNGEFIDKRYDGFTTINNLIEYYNTIYEHKIYK